MVAYLGIDVSKGYADLCLLSADKKPLEEIFRLDDTRKGHDSLRRILANSIHEHELEQIFCAVESTGGFENNWYATIISSSEQLPVKVARLNPLGVKHNAEAGLNRNVTDALSSKYIAEYLICHPAKVDYTEQDTYYASFRSLHKHILMLKKQNNQLVNELKMVLYSSFPEMMRYCKSGVPKWALELLSRYPTATLLAKARVGTVAKIKGITIERAGKLKAKAEDSVASRNNKAMEFMISSLASQIQEKQRLIESHKDFLAKNCEGNEVGLLKSMIGVADYTAAAIMIELEDIKRFATPAHLASYFGMHPVVKESGDRSASKLSKKGRASLRAIMFMPAHTAVMYDPHLKAIYHRHRSKGKSHKQAIVVVMHKMLRIVHGILSSGIPYDAKVDDDNQQKQTAGTREEDHARNLKSVRRFQSEDIDAPISRIEKKKRRVFAESQVCIAEHVRDHPLTPVANL
jgi:transposase